MRPGTRNIYFLPGLSIFMLEKKPAIFYCLYFCSAVLKAFYETWYAYQHVSKKEKHVLNLILVTIQLCRQKSTKIGVNSNSLFAWLENYYTQFPTVATSFCAGKVKRHTPAYLHWGSLRRYAGKKACLRRIYPPKYPWIPDWPTGRSPPRTFCHSQLKWDRHIHISFNFSNEERSFGIAQTHLSHST